MSGIVSALYANPMRMVGQFATAADGTFSLTNLIAGLRYWVQPIGAGAFFNDTLSLSGTTLSGSFKQANTGGLGITLGTLLTVQAFSAPTAPVTYNLYAAQDCPLS